LPDEEFKRCQKELERVALHEKGESPVIETLELAAFRAK
jgi:hypothetical protein